MTVFSRRLCVTKPFSASWQHWDQASVMPECEFGTISGTTILGMRIITMRIF